MKTPRFSILGLMAGVLLVALDFGIGKALVEALVEAPLSKLPRNALLIFAGLPMGNILGIACLRLFAARREAGSRRTGLAGFVLAGSAAWLVFIAFAQLTFGDYRGVPRPSNVGRWLRMAAFVAGFYLTPQLVVAMIGRSIGRTAGS